MVLYLQYIFQQFYLEKSFHTNKIYVSFLLKEVLNNHKKGIDIIFY